MCRIRDFKFLSGGFLYTHNSNLGIGYVQFLSQRSPTFINMLLSGIIFLVSVKIQLCLVGWYGTFSFTIKLFCLSLIQIQNKLKLLLNSFFGDIFSFIFMSYFVLTCPIRAYLKGENKESISFEHFFFFI